MIFLQETWLRSFNLTNITRHFNGYRWFNKTLDSRLHPEDQINRRNMSQHGTAMAIKLDLADSATEIINDEQKR